MASIKKQTALYIFSPNTQYECRDCSMFISNKNRCSIHGPNDVINVYGSCGFFVHGKPMPDQAPMGEVNKKESGYLENIQGFSCKRCSYYISPNDCEEVDKNSEGDTPGIIHPNACCNNWKADPQRSKLHENGFSKLITLLPKNDPGKLALSR